MHICDALRNDQSDLKELVAKVLDVEEEETTLRNELIQQLIELLIPHQRAEEAVLYNSLRMIEASRELAMECYIRHMEIEGLLRILQVQDMANLNWRETAGRLQMAIDNHVINEELMVFSATETLFTDDEAEVMAEVFQEIKGTASAKGFLGTTFDMVTNLMPPAFTDTIRDTFNQTNIMGQRPH
ncbi:MAG: hemerythrin domain-containing protein [Pseudobdellovibrionaceae bacterium]